MIRNKGFFQFSREIRTNTFTVRLLQKRILFVGHLVYDRGINFFKKEIIVLSVGRMYNYTHLLFCRG